MVRLNLLEHDGAARGICLHLLPGSQQQVKGQQAGIIYHVVLRSQQGQGLCY